MPDVVSFCTAFRWSLDLASRTLVCRVARSSQRTGLSGWRESYQVISVYSWGTRLKDKDSEATVDAGPGFPALDNMNIFLSVVFKRTLLSERLLEAKTLEGPAYFTLGQAGPRSVSDGSHLSSPS